MGTLNRTKSHILTNENPYRVLLDLAKVSYTQKMDKLVKINETTLDTTKLRELHETAVQSALKLVAEARQVTVKQESEVKHTLDQMLIQYFSKVKPPKPPQKFDVGVYINYNIFKIGVYTQKDGEGAQRSPVTDTKNDEATGSFSEALSLTPEIYFSEDGIIIGKKARVFQISNDNRYFDIFELIGSIEPKPLHSFHVRSMRYTFCSHEIIAAFIQKALLSLINISNSNYKSGKMIVTVPFLPLSSITERITKSVKILGFGVSEIRVLSTLVTTAVAFTGKKREGLNSIPNLNLKFPGKYAIVLDIQRASFSIGVVLLRPHWIYLAASARSYDVSECKERPFLQIHSRLFDGVEVPLESKSHVYEIYARAVERLILNSKLLARQDYDIVVGEALNNSNLENNARINVIVRMFFEILKKRVNILSASLDVSPLLGAAMLASLNSNSDTGAKNNALNNGAENTNASPPIEVEESTRFYHILQTNFEGVEKQDLILFYKPLIFEVPFNKVGSNRQKFLITLHQQYPLGGAMFEVCRYDLVLERNRADSNQYEPIYANLNSMIPVRINYTVDSNGTYCLEAATRASAKVTVTMTRRDYENCDSECQNHISCAFGKLIDYLDAPAPAVVTAAAPAQYNSSNNLHKYAGDSTFV